LLFTIFASSAVGTVVSGTFMVLSAETTMVYVDPPYNSAPVNQTFTINVSVAEVTNLYSWGIKLYIKKIVLETNLSMIEEGPFLKRNGDLTQLNAGYDGLYWNIGCSITTPSQGVNGSGTLVSITFKVLTEGESNIALIETNLRNPDIILIPHTVNEVQVDGQKTKGGYFNSEKVEVINEVQVNGQNFTVITTTNSSVSPVPFNIDIGQKKISFNVIGPDGMTGYCNVSIPKPFMNCSSLGDWTVTVGGSPPASSALTENSTHTFVYFTYATSTHKVEISSTYIAPEFPTSVFLLILALATIAAALLRKKFRLARHDLSHK
jgi:predicted secreted protein with PEFG-CTERM motif